MIFKAKETALNLWDRAKKHLSSTTSLRIRTNGTVAVTVLFCLVVFAALAQAAQTYVIAHFPYGGGWSTQLWFTNSGSTTANVEVQWFSQAGTATPVPLQGQGTQSTQQFALSPNSTQVVGADVTQRNATGPSGLQVTWATATSSAPVNVFSLFDYAPSSVATITPASQLVTSVGTQSVAPATSFRFPVAEFGQVGLPKFDAGIAVANPNGTSTILTLKLLSASGSIVGTIQRTLPANGQATVILSDPTAFLSVLDPTSMFLGSLAVCATQPVGMVAIGVEGTQYFTTAVTNDPCP